MMVNGAEGLAIAYCSAIDPTHTPLLTDRVTQQHMREMEQVMRLGGGSIATEATEPSMVLLR